MTNRFANHPDVGHTAICLSGGGFRATFFHLGALKALQDANRLLFVRDVFSVSGGSILAAVLATQWNPFSASGNAASFDEAVRRLRDLAQCDLRGRILRRWLSYGWLPGGAGSRVRLLEREYEQRLTDAEVGSFAQRPLGRHTDFHFLATSLTTGRAVAFTADGFYDGRDEHSAKQLKVALAVAASSAFPPLFPPIRVSHDDLVLPVQNFPVAQELTDGGIYGNVGIGRMAEVVAQYPRKDNVVFISDASAPFAQEQANRGSRGFVSRHQRAIDVLMKRIADLEDRCLALDNARVIRISIEDVVSPQDLDPPWTPYALQDQEVQKRVAQIRTDLNVFSDAEICALMRHGYEVTLKQLVKEKMHRGDYAWSDPCGTVFSEPSPEKMGPEDLATVRAALQRSKTRPLGLWSNSDRASFSLLGMGLVYLSAVVLLLLGLWAMVR